MNKLKLTIPFLILISNLSYSQIESIKNFKVEPQKIYLEQYLKEYRNSTNVIDDKLLASLDLEEFLLIDNKLDKSNNPIKTQLKLTGIVEMKDTNDLYEIILQFDHLTRTDYKNQRYKCSLNGIINNNEVSFDGNISIKDIKKSKYGGMGDFYLCTYEYTFTSNEKNKEDKPIRILKGVYTVCVSLDSKALKTYMRENESGEFSDINNVFVGTLTKLENNKQYISKTVFGDKFYTPIRELPLINFNAIFEDYGKFKPTMTDRFKNIIKLNEYNW